MNPFIQIHDDQNQLVVINALEISSIYPSTSYSRGNVVVVRMKNGDEYAFTRETVSSIQDKINKALKP